MPYLNLERFSGTKKNKTSPVDRPVDNPQVHPQPYSRGGAVHRRASHRTGEEEQMATKEQQGIIDVEKMVLEGRQRDLAEYFDNWSRIPARLGEWDLRINIRKQDNVAVSRTIVALPLTVRAREIFEQGCLATLVAAGFNEDDAKRYYKAAWKKKFVWVDGVISATKEMIDAFQNTSVLDQYEQAGDPRRLASTVKVPNNPYQTSHAHFLVAVTMARLVIQARQAAGHSEDPITVHIGAPHTDSQALPPLDEPVEFTTSGMMPI